MDSTAVQSTISAAAALCGAAVGAGAILVAQRRAEAADQRKEHDDALVALWAALGAFVHLWGATSELLPSKSGFVARTLQGVQLGSFGSLLVERQFVVGEQLFTAIGRVRLVASDEELAVVDEVEDAIAGWMFGTPVPEAIETALPKLRRLLERAGRAQFAGPRG